MSLPAPTLLSFRLDILAFFGHIRTMKKFYQTGFDRLVSMLPEKRFLISRLLALPVLVGGATVFAAGAGEQTNAPVSPRSIRKLVADGRHNAFTALVKWKDQYWLGFRNGKAHDIRDGDIVVLRSADTESWTEAFRLNILADDRDPEFLATPARLFLYVSAMAGAKLTSFVTYSDDGATWSKPEPVYEPQFIFWKPLAHGERFYATAHKKAETASSGKEREVHLITSADGIHWEKVSTIRAGNWESETTLLFGPDERLYAFIRTKYSVPGHIMESSPPYKEWAQRPAGVHLSGHSVYTFRGVTYLFSRSMDASGKKTGTMIYTFADGALKPYCALPSGGDCSYPSAVEVGDEMLVSYYSSHEGTTNIYLARVPLKK